MAEYKKVDDDDGFPLDFNLKKYQIKGNNSSTKQSGNDEYIIKNLSTIVDDTKPIYKCMGQLLMDFGAKDNSFPSGTGTIFKKFVNDFYLVITAAHNAVQYDKITGEKDEVKRVWIFPKGCGEEFKKFRMQMVRKAIYTHYKPEKDCSPHDLAVLLFQDRKGVLAQYYADIDINEMVQINEWKYGDDAEDVNIYGFPSKSGGLLQGTSGDAELNRDRGLWCYSEIYTYPGQSGSAIFKRIRKKPTKQYAIYGNHTFGNTQKQRNCGVYLDGKKRVWIEQKVAEFEAFAKANAPKRQQKAGGQSNSQFEFDRWIKDNGLHDIRGLLVKHKMTETDTLNVNSAQYVQLMSNPELFAKGHEMMTKLIVALQRVPAASDKAKVKVKHDQKPIIDNTECKSISQTTFLYESDFDENGICYAIGSNYGQKQWWNPVIRGFITIRSSRWNTNGSKIEQIFGRKQTPFYCNSVGNAQNSWFSIDFGAKLKIKPTHYTLRSSKQDSCYLRTWNFEGSNDGNNWNVLKQHQKDTSLNSNVKSHTWSVQCNDRYQMFRIYMMGKCSHDLWQLMCSGFEIYGDLIGSI